MDLNELHFRHQIALMRSANTTNRGERERHNAAADGFASRIGLIQRRGGALAAPLPMSAIPAAIPAGPAETGA